MCHVLGAEKGGAVGVGVVGLSFLVYGVLVPVSRLVLPVFGLLLCCFGGSMRGYGPVQCLSVFLQR